MKSANTAENTIRASQTIANQPPNPSFLCGATSTDTGVALPAGST